MNSAPPICPECGLDPRRGQIAPPPWAHLTGAPLVLAVVVLLAFALAGLHQERHTRTGNSTSARDPWSRPTLLTADVRAAADGDDAQARRIARTALDLARRDPMVFRTATLAVEPFQGIGWHMSQWRIGWPLHWLTTTTSTGYNDIDRQTSLQPAPSDLAPTWRWVPHEPGASLNSTSNGQSRSINCNFGALACIILVIVLASTLLVMLTSRIPRMRSSHTRYRRVALPLLILSMAALLLLPLRREQELMLWPARPGVPGFTLTTVEEMAQTTAGARELAQLMAAHLHEAPDDALVKIFWLLPTSTRDATSAGWPMPWLSWGTDSPVNPPVRGPRQRRLTLLDDCIILTTLDPSGVKWYMAFNLAAFIAILPALLFCLSPRLIWRTMRSRRQQRSLSESRCLHCGYRHP